MSNIGLCHILYLSMYNQKETYFQRWHFYSEITCCFLKFCFNCGCQEVWRQVLWMAVLKAGKREVSLCFLTGVTLCSPDLFQGLVTETSHSVAGRADLQCCSSAGDTQTGIQPSNVARTWLISMVEDWGPSPKPESRVKRQLKGWSAGPASAPHGEGKQPHAVLTNILSNGHTSKYSTRLHGNKQNQNKNVENLQISRCALSSWKLDDLD